MPNSWEYLCIHLIPRPPTLQPQPNQVEMLPVPEQPAGPTPTPNQVEIPPELESMYIDILEDKPDLIDTPEEILLDSDAQAHSVLEYQ